MIKAGSLTRGLAIGAIGAISVTTAGLGVATAANGGSLVLGHSNTATKTTTLKNSKGIPLALIGKKTKPPFKVNSSQLVKHLNAAEVGGLTPGQVSNGSGAQLNWNLITALGGGGSISAVVIPHSSGSTFIPTLMSSTAALAAGTYVVNATQLVESGTVYCWLNTSPAFATTQWGISGDGLEAFESRTFTVKKGQRIGAYCFNASTSDDAFALSDSINAVQVQHVTTGSVTQYNGVTSVRKK